MPLVSVREVVDRCLHKTLPISIRRDVLGVYGLNNLTRSLSYRIHLILNVPFVRLAVVVVRSPEQNGRRAGSDIQPDLDVANQIYLEECGAWIYCAGTALVVTDRFGPLTDVELEDCWSNSSHEVSEDEDDLFSLGRDLGASIVAYLTGGNNQAIGCAAHPPGRRGFSLAESVSSYTDDPRAWIFTHELSHVLGLPHADEEPPHVDEEDRRYNLMRGGSFTALEGTNLTPGQCEVILADPAMERCEPGRRTNV
jgi:hypothetical protein